MRRIFFYFNKLCYQFGNNGTKFGFVKQIIHLGIGFGSINWPAEGADDVIVGSFGLSYPLPFNFPLPWNHSANLALGFIIT